MKFVINRILLILFIVIPVRISAQSIDEYTLKAIWLGKFTHFIEWPEKNKANSFFTIGVFNTDPFQGKLETIYSTHQIDNKPVRIKYFKTLDSIQVADILFISANNEKFLPRITKIAGDCSILLIGDTKGYAEKGVHINFFNSEKQIRFEINESAMRDSEFFVSFRLLNIAKIVQPISNE